MNSSSQPPMFVPNLFLRVLIAALVVVLIGFVGIRMLMGPIELRDIVGSLICTPIVAYLVHLWLAPMDASEIEEKGH